MSRITPFAGYSFEKGKRTEFFEFLLFFVGLQLLLIDPFAFIGSTPVNKIGAVIGLVLIILCISIKKGLILKIYTSWSRRVLLLFLFFVLSEMLSYIRTNNFTLSEFNIYFKVIFSGLAILLHIVFISSYSSYGIIKPKHARKIFGVFIVGMMIFFLANSLLYFSMPPIFTRELRLKNFMLGILGVDLIKSAFPLLPWHTYNVAILAGGTFTMSSILLLRKLEISARLKKLLWGTMSSSFIILLLGDSRGVLLFSFLAIGLVFGAIQIRTIRHLRLLVVGLPFLQMLLFFSLKTVAESDLMPNLTRNEKSNELLTGNSRLYIFEALWNDLREPKLIHVYGYGEFGLYRNGAINEYAKYFGITKESRKIWSSVAHNMFFNILICQGYIGAGIFLLFNFILLTQANYIFKHDPLIGTACLGFLAFHLLAGITDGGVALNIGYHPRLFMFIFIMIYHRSLQISASYSNQPATHTTNSTHPSPAVFAN